MNPLDQEDYSVGLEHLLIGQNQSLNNKSTYAEGTIDMDSNGNLSIFLNGEWKKQVKGERVDGDTMPAEIERPVYTETELDNATFEAYNQGKQVLGEELLKALAAEEDDLKSYGRTDLYGIHKAMAIIQQKLSELPNQEDEGDANIPTDSNN